MATMRYLTLEADKQAILDEIILEASNVSWLEAGLGPDEDRAKNIVEGRSRILLLARKL